MLESDESGLIELLKELSGCRRLGLLVTSRLALPQEVFYQQREVQRMGGDALQVFKRYAPPVEQWGTETTQAEIDQLLQLLDGYPFPLRLAGAYMKARRCTVREMLAALQQNPRETFRPISRQENRDNSLVATLELSYQVLPPDARYIFALLSLFPGGLTPELAMAITGKESRETLAVLLEFSMAEQSSSTTTLRITLPEPARFYAESKLEADVREVMLKALEYFYCIVHQVSTELTQNQSSLGKRLIQAESANLNRCLQWGYEQETAANGICYSAGITASLAQHWQWVSLGENPLEQLLSARDAAQRSQDWIGQAQVWKSKGDFQLKGEGLQVAQSAYEQSIQYYKSGIQQCAKPLEVAEIYCKVAEIWQLCQQPDQAIASYQLAVEIYQAEGEGLSAAPIQILIGQLQVAKENYEAAIASYQSAKELYGAHHDLAGVARADASISRLKYLISSPLLEFATVTVNPQGEVIERVNRSVKCFMQKLRSQTSRRLYVLRMRSQTSRRLYVLRMRSQTSRRLCVPRVRGWVSLELIAIPAGTFLMGSLEEEPGSFRYEKPQHEVSVPAFFMGRYPVTQAQWRAVAMLPPVNQELKPDPSCFKGENRPVERVSWWDAMELCARLSQYTGRNYRLPSEAEWEYACRAGTETPFHFGETITTELANYNGNYTYGDAPKGKYWEQTTVVGSFPPNDFGLFDMHGNVWEWCLDCWHENYEGAPTDGSAWNVGGDNGRRILRGGSWFLFPRYCRSATRYYYDPGSRDLNIGFRVVCEMPRT